MKRKRLLENLSRRQRQHTPHDMAEMLLLRVRQMFDQDVVAVLWCHPSSIYKTFLGTDCWDQERDANLYDGPFPIIGHPPCGPWGKYRANCHHSRQDGIRAMELVHRFGGVVEQPLGSSLFYEHGGRALIQQCNQWDFGHLCLKPTLLYWIGPEQVDSAL